MPSAASGADTYVNQATGSDSDAAIGCPSSDPCQTIQVGINTATPNATVHVVDPAVVTTYAESLTLSNGKLLVAESTNPAETIINNGAAAAPAVSISGVGGGVHGFTIRSDQQPVHLFGPASVDGNVFDQNNPPTGTNGGDVRLETGAGAAQITNNTFTDSTSDLHAAIVNVSSGSPLIAGNTISGFNTGIFAFVNGGTPVIENNDVSGTHSDGATAGVGILVRDQHATVEHNFVHGAGAGATNGIAISEFSGPATTAAELSRNRVIGHQTGVFINNTAGAVTLDSDLVAKSTVQGLRTFDLSLDGGADATATNVTLYDSAVDIELGGTQLGLDSSIVEGPISDNSGATCNITFSRGPTTSGTTCQSFQTAADPLFVNPGTDDYHLQPGSPLIDAGNPAAPPAGTLDLDGDPRALDGDGVCPPRRDIGADERVLVPATTCPPPETAFDPPATDPPPDDDRLPRETDPPETTAKKPKVKGDDMTIKFSSDEPGSSFRCRLDRKKLKPCTSPKTYRNLDPGKHKFLVVATDPAGNADASAAKRKFEIG